MSFGEPNVVIVGLSCLLGSMSPQNPSAATFAVTFLTERGPNLHWNDFLEGMIQEGGSEKPLFYSPPRKELSQINHNWSTGLVPWRTLLSSARQPSQRLQLLTPLITSQPLLVSLPQRKWRFSMFSSRHGFKCSKGCVVKVLALVNQLIPSPVWTGGAAVLEKSLSVPVT